MRGFLIVFAATLTACASSSNETRHEEWQARADTARARREQHEAAMVARARAEETSPATTSVTGATDGSDCEDPGHAFVAELRGLGKHCAERRAAGLEKRCAESRDERMKQLASYMARREQRESLIAWEDAHCKFVDKSRPVVRVVQDANGEYHSVEGRDRGVDRVCDEKLPTEIRTTWARHVGLVAPSSAVADPDCRDADVKASDVAKRYWTER